MSNATRMIGYVVTDGEKVLTYTDLRSIGFIGTGMEEHFLAGNHGIDGLMTVVPTDRQEELLDEEGLSVAFVETPWFKDCRLAMEPAVVSYVHIEEDKGLEVSLTTHSGFTEVSGDDCEGLEVWVKPSIAFYSNNSKGIEIDLLTQLTWRYAESSKPKMPSAEEVLRQMSSAPSVEEQFANAFSKPKVKPVETKSAAFPINHGKSIIQFSDETFVWYDEAGFQGGVCYSLEDARSKLAAHGDRLSKKNPVPPKAKVATPIDHSALLDGMFGVLIK